MAMGLERNKVLDLDNKISTLDHQCFIDDSSWKYYSITVPSGTTFLEVEAVVEAINSTDSKSNYVVFAKWGDLPTTSDNVNPSITVPIEGIWYFGVSPNSNGFGLQSKDSALPPCFTLKFNLTTCYPGDVNSRCKWPILSLEVPSFKTFLFFSKN